MPRPNLVLEVMFRFMVLLYLGFKMISVVHVTTGGRGTMCVKIWGLNLHHPLLILVELALPPYCLLQQKSWLYPLPERGSHSSQDLPSPLPTRPAFELINLNIYPIFDMQKGLVLQNHKHRIFMTWGNRRISNRSFSECPILIIYQKPEGLNQTNISLKWTFVSKLE